MNFKIFWFFVIIFLYDILMGVLNCKKYLNICLFSVKLFNNRIMLLGYIIVRLIVLIYLVDKVGVYYSYLCFLFIYLLNYFFVIVILVIYGYVVYFCYGLIIMY